VNQCLADAADDVAEARYKDGTATTEVLVQWDAQPASHNSTGQVRGRVYKALDPWLVFKSELDIEEDLCTVDNGLVCDKKSVH